jgi:Zn-dependent M28 family amino/carboxypeptidase
MQYFQENLKPTICNFPRIDHLGMKESGTDIIYNGANDDASGVTAVITLQHFKELNNNERTIIFLL